MRNDSKENPEKSAVGKNEKRQSAGRLTASSNFQKILLPAVSKRKEEILDTRGTSATSREIRRGPQTSLRILSAVFSDSISASRLATRSS